MKEKQMKAVMQDRYGSPDVLQIKEVDKPTPRDNEVLIRVHASTVTPPDRAFREGDPFIARLFSGLIRPKFIPGSELAGEVEQVGKDVTLFREGDLVFGSAGPKFGAHAEYKCLPEDGVVENMPVGLSYEEAVAIADGALTALPFLRDNGGIRSGQEILINGASGSVGAAAVQLARYFGATVTGVCSTANLELVKSLGADYVVDYTEVDFTATGRKYDIIFDAIGKSNFRKCRVSLNESGIYLTTVPSWAIMFQMLSTRVLGRKRATIAFTGLTMKRERLTYIKERAEAGDLKSVIDRRYPLQQITEAHRYVDTERKRGSVVLTI
jgi:NADPH:quinone reductase-like Zn-dependent oxidoreductase